MIHETSFFPAMPLLAAIGWDTAFLCLLGVALGAGGLYAWLQLSGLKVAKGREAEADRRVKEADERREEILRSAEVEAQKKHLEMKERFDAETAETRKELKDTERRIAKREDNLDKKLDVLSTKEKKIEDAQARVEQAEAEIGEKRQRIDELLAEQRQQLLNISKLSPEEAKAMCLKRIEQELEREAGQLIEKTLSDAKENAQEQSRKIVIEAIQRYAAEHTCETTVATIDVPSDDMKGRIIGREGRNIRAFEKATGVTVIVDDTPGVVSVSVFDPIRKEVARLAMERLVRDGRIHPTRIEEVVQKAQAEVEEKVMEAGKRAALEANVNGLNKKLIEQMGRLHYRTSYGQNVLRHSVEVAHLCGIMAEELGLDGALARRCGLLHDIGKAMPHDQVGTHTQLGADFVKRFNEHAAVINACAGHHGDVPAEFVYTPLVASADAISASRPGGRRESLEHYIRRLQELESIAYKFDGVEQAYALEAGRELRVIVSPTRVDDMSSLKLARDIAKEVEENMQYPGEIKVSVLREMRAIEYAR